MSSTRSCPDWPSLLEVAPDLHFKHYTLAEARLPAEVGLLLPLDQVVAAVAEDHVDDGEAQPLGGLELLDVHQKAAVAAHRHHLALGVDELGRDGGGQGKAHGGQAIGDQHRIGLVGGKGPGDPELVGADVRDENVLSPHARAEQLAAAAGLGTLDADGRLVTRELGTRVHVANVIVTDLPLAPDG